MSSRARRSITKAAEAGSELGNRNNEENKEAKMPGFKPAEINSIKEMMEELLNTKFGSIPDKLDSMDGNLDELRQDIEKCKKDSEKAKHETEKLVVNEIEQQLAKSTQLFIIGVENKQQVQDLLDNIAEKEVEIRW